jgi:hypothetical protein
MDHIVQGTIPLEKNTYKYVKAQQLCCKVQNLDGIIHD